MELIFTFISNGIRMWLKHKNIKLLSPTQYYIINQWNVFLAASQAALRTALVNKKLKHSCSEKYGADCSLQKKASVFVEQNYGLISKLKYYLHISFDIFLVVLTYWFRWSFEYFIYLE